ncbi:MAG: hypothetical protein AAFP17_13745 [Pseudomonadota bacterium]
MRTLGSIYWVVQCLCLALGGLALLYGVFNLVRMFAVVLPTLSEGGVSLADEWIVFMILGQLLPAAIFLGIGAVLHWLRQRAVMREARA